MDINQIALWVGYIILFLSLLIIIAIFMYIIYYCYDYWLKKLLKWENVEIRKDIYYYMRHKKEIKEYINKNNKEG